MKTDFRGPFSEQGVLHGHQRAKGCGSVPAHPHSYHSAQVPAGQQDEPAQAQLRPTTHYIVHERRARKQLPPLDNTRSEHTFD